jgi:transglutaminase-like putative cysteine protease
MSSYQFKLTFPKNSNKSFSLFSLPQPSPYHQISNLKINSQNFKIINEKKWGNKIVILNLIQDPKQHNFISFKLKPLPFKFSINPSFTLSFYQKTKIPKVYLTPNRFINGKDEKIKSLAKKVLGQETNLLTMVKKLYDFTLEYLTYGKPIDGLYSYSQALKEKTTDCGGFSTFLASLLQSQNIPSRLVVGFIIKKNIIKDLLNPFHVLRYTFHNLFMHAWLEVLLPDGGFFPLDPSIEWRRKKGKTQRQGGFGFTQADRLVTSYGCDFKLNINGKNYKIDLLQKPIYR